MTIIGYCTSTDNCAAELTACYKLTASSATTPAYIGVPTITREKNGIGECAWK